MSVAGVGIWEHPDSHSFDSDAEEGLGEGDKENTASPLLLDSNEDDEDVWSYPRLCPVSPDCIKFPQISS